LSEGHAGQKVSSLRQRTASPWPTCPNLPSGSSRRTVYERCCGEGPILAGKAASALDVKADTLKKTVQRFPDLFTKHKGADGENRLALVERRYGS
jgi:hypothetical protein